jgi:hypothetical protein
MVEASIGFAEYDMSFGGNFTVALIYRHKISFFTKILPLSPVGYDKSQN